MAGGATYRCRLDPIVCPSGGDVFLHKVLLSFMTGSVVTSCLSYFVSLIVLFVHRCPLYYLRETCKAYGCCARLCVNTPILVGKKSAEGTYLGELLGKVEQKYFRSR